MCDKFDKLDKSAQHARRGEPDELAVALRRQRGDVDAGDRPFLEHERLLRADQPTVQRPADAH